MLIDQYREFLAALHFLSTLSLPGTKRLFREEDVGSRLIVGSVYFPVVGILLALLLGGFALVVTPFLPSLVLAALLVIAQILLTGGLHLDGLMDSCDGLFSGRSRDQKLEIMRDSRVGSFGVLGGICVLLLKFACFTTLTGHQLWLACMITLPCARWCMVLALFFFPNARPAGLGFAVRQDVTRERLLIAAMIALVVAIVAGHVVGILVWVVTTIAAFALGRWITSVLGGLTGDNYGAIEEVMECLALLLLIIVRIWL